MLYIIINSYIQAVFESQVDSLGKEKRNLTDKLNELQSIREILRENDTHTKSLIGENESLKMRVNSLERENQLNKVISK